ncbi:MAG: TonB-dependent receptor [Pseudomonadota bacterium]
MRTIRTVLPAFCLVAAPPALAQSDTPAEAGPIVLDPITVTARRTEEELRDVPASVVVLTDEEIARSNIKDTSDAILNLPNVSFTDDASPIDLEVSIRGVSNLIGGAANGPTNGIFVDGVLINPLGGTSAINSSLLDVERVETILGPQGTTFGRGTIGGAINFVTKKPVDAFEASLEGEVGSFPDGEGQILINVPLLPDELLLARLAGFGRASDGFIDLVNVDQPNSVGSASGGFRLSLRSKPIEALTLDASLSYDITDFDAPNTASLASFEAGDPVLESDFIGENELERLFVTGEIAYESDVGLFKSTSSYIDTDNEGFGDGDLSGLDIIIGETSDTEASISQEFRYESAAFDVPAGLGAVSVNGGVSFSFNEISGTSLLSFGDDTLPPTPGDAIGTLSFPFENNVFNVSVYGDVRWEPIPDLELTAGARFNRDAVEATGATESSGLVSILVPSSPPFFAEEVFTDVSPTASIRYAWTEDFATYFRFGTGYRPGGFTLAGGGLTTFEEESVRSFEAGFNTAFFDNRLFVNGSGFFLDYDDIQVAALDPLSPVPGATFTTNAASARSVGSELTVIAQPIDGLVIDARWGLTFASFTDFTTSPFGDLTGDTLPNAPRNTFSLRIDYEHPEPLLADLNGFVRAEYTLRSDFTTVIDPDIPTFDGFDIVNFRLGLRGENMEVTAFVENAFNEIYATGTTTVSLGGFLGGPPLVDVGRTRRFGIKGRVFF